MKNKRGSILLFSLIILSVLLATGVVVSGIILRSLRSVGQVRSGLQAWYAATSGVEYALSELRHNRATPADLPLVNLEVGDGSRAALSVQQQDTYTVARIPRNTSAHIDIFLPDNDLSGPPARRIVLKGQGEPGAWVEVRWVGWLNNVAWVRNLSATLFSAAELGGAGRMVDLTQGVQFVPEDGAGGVFQPIAWRVEVTALYGDITNLTVVAQNGLGEPVPVPAHAVIRSIGTFRNAQQNVSVSVPIATPLSDLFHFVLFSEDRITK